MTQMDLTLPIPNPLYLPLVLFYFIIDMEYK